MLAHPHHPFPDPATGTLLVDPDITLKALGFDLEINLFYNSRSNANGAFGKKRSISTNAYLLKITSDFGNTVQLVRGDEKVYEFDEGSTSSGVTTYNGVNTQYSGTQLVWDSNTSEWIETFPDGKQIIYDENLGGSPERWNIGRIEDPSGNIHTYAYGTGSEAGLLKTIEVPGGRVVTFNYEPGGSPTSLLHEIQDWGGRIWTMQYDANRELTTLTTPLGCATK